MYQLPTPLWNEIAKTQNLATPLWTALFKATDLPPALQPLEADLEAAGADDRTIRAFLLVAPLLHENLAISRFIEQTGRTDLRNSLPELVTASEATTLASSDLRLTPRQEQKLHALLLEFRTKQPSSASAPLTR